MSCGSLIIPFFTASFVISVAAFVAMVSFWTSAASRPAVAFELGRILHLLSHVNRASVLPLHPVRMVQRVSVAINRIVFFVLITYLSNQSILWF